MLHRTTFLLLALLLVTSLGGCAAVPEGMGIVYRAVRGHHNAQQHARPADSDAGKVAHAQEQDGTPSTDASEGSALHDAPAVDEVATGDAAEPVVELMPLPSTTPIPLPTPTTPPTPTVDPLASAGKPIRIEIPAIGVDAFVEEVGLTAERAMDVPKGWMNAGWYANGYLPGETGNAVIAGHLDTSTGGPAIFWDLNQLVAGDEIHVHYSGGSQFTFVVEASKVYEHDAEGAIIDSIFGKSMTPDLNLVTCDGAWDHGAATYSKRLVVFSTLAP